MADDIQLTWSMIGTCLAYPKADGWRIQIHRQGRQVQLLTRNGLDYTNTFSTIANAVQKHMGEERLILDAELVGFDSDGSYLLPSRLASASRFVCYVLDALYLAGTDLTPMPALERLRVMQYHLQDSLRSPFMPAGFSVVPSARELVTLYEDCLNNATRGLDGVIVKRLDAPYFVRALKLKSSDTADAVILGAYKHQDTYDRLLLAVPDHTRGIWVPLAIVSRENTLDWDRVWTACAPYLMNVPTYNISSVPRAPSVWIAPHVVVQVTMEGIRWSKNYEMNAYAVRDCKLREDKGAEEATPFEYLHQIYRLSLEPRRKSAAQSCLFGSPIDSSTDHMGSRAVQSDESYFVEQLGKWIEPGSSPHEEKYRQLRLFN
jgi:DNA ligase 1